MIRVDVLATKETLRLVRNPADGRCAVVEVRGGRAYSPHGRHRRDAPATPEGMAAVVDADEWRDESAARAWFDSVAEDGDHFARRVW
ncbi:hypothetical protein ACM64Y_16025 [Novispirillum sp. DQ9]|uniref:hypothetical protein n=1 Tax=Novispirillum sp. DQ9 TaxID=3398612 RepID=UPI003C7A5A50